MQQMAQQQQLPVNSAASAAVPGVASAVAVAGQTQAAAPAAAGADGQVDYSEQWAAYYRYRSFTRLSLRRAFAFRIARLTISTPLPGTTAWRKKQKCTRPWPNRRRPPNRRQPRTVQHVCFTIIRTKTFSTPRSDSRTAS